MDKQFLTEYEQIEKEKHDEFRKKVNEGKFGLNDIFPSKEQFHKIQKPIAFRMQTKEFYPQIPFSGSTVTMIFPVKKESFKKVHGFEISDINRLVDFTKETGKVQFVIDWPPTAYEGLDFLDPIFIELKPPTIPVLPGYSTLSKTEELATIDEFEMIENFGFYDLIKSVHSQEAANLDLTIAKKMHDYKIGLITLKSLGLDELAEAQINLMIDDPERAYNNFNVIISFICSPRDNSLRPIFNYDFDYLKTSFGIVEPGKYSFPCEVGKFLMQKLIYYPESLTACQEIIAHYEDYDLIKVFSALNDGIQKTDFDVVNSNVENISEILENVWDDKTVKRRKKYIEFGIPISLAAIGTIAAGPIGTMGGLLAGLGFSVGKELMKTKKGTISDKFAEARVDSSQLNIYDFKKKYKLK